MPRISKQEICPLCRALHAVAYFEYRVGNAGICMCPVCAKTLLYAYPEHNIIKREFCTIWNGENGTARYAGYATLLEICVESCRIVDKDFMWCFSLQHNVRTNIWEHVGSSGVRDIIFMYCQCENWSIERNQWSERRQKETDKSRNCIKSIIVEFVLLGKRWKVDEIATRCPTRSRRHN